MRQKKHKAGGAQLVGQEFPGPLGISRGVQRAMPWGRDVWCGPPHLDLLGAAVHGQHDPVALADAVCAPHLLREQPQTHMHVSVCGPQCGCAHAAWLLTPPAHSLAPQNLSRLPPALSVVSPRLALAAT